MIYNIWIFSRCLELAEDEIGDDSIDRYDLLTCSSNTLEGFFVVPAGNTEFERDPEYYENLQEGDSES